MNNLPGPVKRYLMGAHPSHSSLAKLHSNFQGVNMSTLSAILEAGGYVANGKATRSAAEAGLIDSCDGKILWNVESVMVALGEQGMTLTREAMNQEVRSTAGTGSTEPTWANLGTVGTYFSVTANKVGKWLDELGLRENGEPSEEARDRGLSNQVEMIIEGKKTRKITHWNLEVTRDLLVEAGHPLDFDYEATLRGRGKNSDVEVDSIDNRAAALFDEWKRQYRTPELRAGCWRLFDKQPKAIVMRVEALMGRPGFIQNKEFLKLR